MAQRSMPATDRTGEPLLGPLSSPRVFPDKPGSRSSSNGGGSVSAGSPSADAKVRVPPPTSDFGLPVVRTIRNGPPVPVGPPHVQVAMQHPVLGPLLRAYQAGAVPHGELMGALAHFAASPAGSYAGPAGSPVAAGVPAVPGVASPVVPVV